MKIFLPTGLLRSAYAGWSTRTDNRTKELVHYLELRLLASRSMDEVEVDAAYFDEDRLDELLTLAKANNERGAQMRLNNLINLQKDPLNTKVQYLKTLSVALDAYLLKDAIDLWLYHEQPDGTLLPYLVTGISYTPRDRHHDPYVSVTLLANGINTQQNSRGSRNYETTNITFWPTDVAKLTIAEMLAKYGFFHETPSFKAKYEEDFERFHEFRPMIGKQFLGCGPAIMGRNKIDLTGSRLVNDEGTVVRSNDESYLNQYWEKRGQEEGRFDRLPYHCTLHMFDLKLHEHVRVHVANLEKYQYNTKLGEKLILPQEHRDLIDILAEDMDVIREDVVAGKSGGTTILCRGEPGLGKTLTAEVYAEVIQKPLYRIHSGQLGTTPTAVEENLEVIMTRGQGWDAIVLLDEADVFIRKRGDDIQHNAVVAAFLRKLEYFNGLLFMTTNRSEDIDDAIISRCIAVVNYKHPEHADAVRIWKVMSQQYGADLQDTLIEELASHFSRASGRDIKELIKLTVKFASKRAKPYSLDLFRQCAMFRGVDMTSSALKTAA